MPPKRNKAPRNGFYYFMMHVRDTSKKKYARIEDTVGEAGALWEKMSAAERMPYNVRAKSNKVNGGDKMTSLNQNVDHVLKYEEEKKNEESQMINDIDATIKRLCATNKIQHEQFHIMHINNFCYSNTEQKNYPAEIALIRFDLQEGVLEENIYHALIHPGKLPLGYQYEAKAKAEETHKLPIPNQNEESNLLEVMTAVTSFLMNSETSHTGSQLPPIFVDIKQIDFVRKVFEQWCYDYEFNVNHFKFYSLEQLFFKLRNNIAGKTVWPTISQTVVELERDVFDYTPAISCAYHEETDVTVHCSRSIVIRYVFIMCDNCCKDLGITFIAGQHVPMKSYINPRLSFSQRSRCGTASSVVSTTDRSDTFRTMKTTFRDDDDEASERGHDDGWSVASYSTRGHRGVSTQPTIDSEPEPEIMQTKDKLRRPKTESFSLMGSNLTGSGPSSNSPGPLFSAAHFPRIGRGRGRGGQMM